MFTALLISENLASSDNSSSMIPAHKKYWYTLLKFFSLGFYFSNILSILKCILFSCYLDKFLIKGKILLFEIINLKIILIKILITLIFKIFNIIHLINFDLFKNFSKFFINKIFLYKIS